MERVPIMSCRLKKKRVFSSLTSKYHETPSKNGLVLYGDSKLRRGNFLVTYTKYIYRFWLVLEVTVEIFKSNLKPYHMISVTNLFLATLIWLAELQGINELLLV